MSLRQWLFELAAETAGEIARNRRWRRKHPQYAGLTTGCQAEGLERRVMLSSNIIAFGAPQTFAVSSRYGSSSVVADVNGDGKADFITANVNVNSNGPNALNTITILPGNGDGTFQAPLSFSANDSFPSVNVADMNGDGHPDLIISGASVQLALGNGDGTFQTPQIIPDAGTAGVLVSDVNGDGKADLVLNREQGLTGALLGNGNGTFQTMPVQGMPVLDPWFLADVNGDGKPDIVAEPRYSTGPSRYGPLLVASGNGDGTFQPAHSITAGPTNLLTVADINGDGKQDLVTLGFSNGNGTTIQILLGNGNGTFQAPHTVFLNGSVAYAANAIDINGDGKLDLVVQDRGGMAILLGNGDGSFQSPQTFAYSGLFADLNGDGVPDLITSAWFGAPEIVRLTRVLPPPDVIAGSGNESITLTRDTDGTDIDWMAGGQSEKLGINDPNGLTINSNGGNDTITLAYTHGSPLPGTLHLNGNFTINGFQGTNPLAGVNLDIGRSTVFVGYSPSDPIAAIKNYLRNGYNSGAWNGTATGLAGAIVSSAAAANPNHTTAIGYADSSDGTGIDTMPNTVELKYTLIGDANLDGQVNSADLQILLFNLNRPGSWDQGDFNYDGQVNSADLQALLFALNTNLGSQTAGVGTAAAVSGTPAPAPPATGSATAQTNLTVAPTPAIPATPPVAPDHPPRRGKRHR